MFIAMFLLLHIILITIWILAKNIKVNFNHATYNEKYYQYSTCSYPTSRKIG